MKRFVVLLCMMAALCMGITAQDGLVTDFTTEAAETPLVIRGDYVLRGTVLVQYLGNAADVIIPDDLGLTEIGEAVFGSGTIRSVVIPEGVIKLGARVFIDCHNLATVTLPRSLLEIGDSAFYLCNSLDSITLPVGLTGVGDSAFSYCGSLDSITLPASLTTIGNGVFYECGNLTTIQVDRANPWYADQDGVLFNRAFTELIVYPAGKTGSSYAIPDSVTSIGNRAFYGCGGLTTVDLPEGLTRIGDETFYYCGSLAAIHLPAGLTAIGNSAFYGCRGLNSITVLTLTPPALNGSLWPWWNPAPAIIHVPASAVDAYKNAQGWKNHADKIQAAP